MKHRTKLQYEICKGHLGIKLNERCSECKTDEYNIFCSGSRKRGC